MLMLLFYIRENMYACETSLILEIIPKIHLKPLHSSPDYVAGFINLAGKPVPVIDLTTLTTGGSSSNDMHTRIVLLKNPLPNQSLEILGIIAEKVTETIHTVPSDFIVLGTNTCNFPYLGGVLNKNEVSIRQVLIPPLFDLLSPVLQK